LMLVVNGSERRCSITVWARPKPKSRGRRVVDRMGRRRSKRFGDQDLGRTVSVFASFLSGWRRTERTHVFGHYGFSQGTNGISVRHACAVVPAGARVPWRTLAEGPGPALAARDLTGAGPRTGSAIPTQTENRSGAFSPDIFFSQGVNSVRPAAGRRTDASRLDRLHPRLPRDFLRGAFRWQGGHQRRWLLRFGRGRASGNEQRRDFRFGYTREPKERARLNRHDDSGRWKLVLRFASQPAAVRKRLEKREGLYDELGGWPSNASQNPRRGKGKGIDFAIVGQRGLRTGKAAVVRPFDIHAPLERLKRNLRAAGLIG